MKKVSEMFGARSHYESIKILLHEIVYDCFNKSDFVKSWGNMINNYKLHNNE
jgi:predicted metallopeptidase